MAVDTHIFRVSNRTGIAPGKTCWKSSANSKFVPAEYMLNAHHWLILLGRYVRGAQTQMPAMRHFRPVRIQAENTRLITRRH